MEAVAILLDVVAFMVVLVFMVGMTLVSWLVDGSP